MLPASSPAFCAAKGAGRAYSGGRGRMSAWGCPLGCGVAQSGGRAAASAPWSGCRPGSAVLWGPQAAATGVEWVCGAARQAPHAPSRRRSTLQGCRIAAVLTSQQERPPAEGRWGTGGTFFASCLRRLCTRRPSARTCRTARRLAAGETQSYNKTLSLVLKHTRACWKCPGFSTTRLHFAPRSGP